MTSTRRALAALLLVAPLLAGCGSEDAADDSGATTATSTASADATTTTAAGDGVEAVTSTTGGGVRSGDDLLRILVTDDDGIAAPGIDILVEALRQLPDTQVSVVAPKDNQSGSGSKENPGPVEVTDSATLSGFPGKAVAGFPVDAVKYALDQGGLPERPHVVLSGITQGANVGPLTNISGTVGAAKAAAARGIPALAASQGLATEPDYDVGVTYVLDWLEEHRADLLAGRVPAAVESLNIPTCPTGEVRGLVEVPTAVDAGGREVMASDCASTSGPPTDDVDGFSNGYVTLSPVGVP